MAVIFISQYEHQRNNGVGQCKVSLVTEVSFTVVSRKRAQYQISAHPHNFALISCKGLKFTLKNAHPIDLARWRLMEQVWYFISKNQPGLQHSDSLKSSPGSHSLLECDSVGITSSCLLLAFPLSISPALSHLHYPCFSVSISNL